MLDHAAFYFFATLAIVAAILTVTVRNVIHSAIFLITALFATAGIFLLLKAQFLFAVQIILYVGGIMVLFLFVIMLVNLDVALHQVQFNRQRWVASLLALILAAQLGLALWVGSSAFKLPAPNAAAISRSNTEDIGQRLFEGYMVPFEVASILLLVAMVGAVVMARKRTT